MNKTSVLFVLGFIISCSAAVVDKPTLKAKVVYADQQSVTLEIAGEAYRFSRKNLGKEFASVKTNEAVNVVVEIPPPPPPAKKK